MRSKIRTTIVILSLLLTSCASVPALTLAGAKVREISREDAKQCTFIESVTFTDTISGMGKSYGLVHQAGANGLRNEVGRRGGNAFVSTQADADWFWGRINYSGEAYRCASP